MLSTSRSAGSAVGAAHPEVINEGSAAATAGDRLEVSELVAGSVPVSNVPSPSSAAASGVRSDDVVSTRTFHVVTDGEVDRNNGDMGRAASLIDENAGVCFEHGPCIDRSTDRKIDREANLNIGILLGPASSDRRVGEYKTLDCGAEEQELRR